MVDGLRWHTFCKTFVELFCLAPVDGEPCVSSKRQEVQEVIGGNSVRSGYVFGNGSVDERKQSSESWGFVNGADSESSVWFML